MRKIKLRGLKESLDLSIYHSQIEQIVNKTSEPGVPES